MIRSRFSAVSRRGFLQGMSAAALLGLVGCATSDADVLKPTAGAAGAASANPSTSASASTAAAGELVVNFTYTADANASSSEGGRGHGGGMVRNPYIAVWVEDTSGALVRTISLWHLQNGQDRWLSELHRWYSAAQGVDTNSSATRAAGSYSVSWDLTDADGKAVGDGDYVLCIEATREHGPYSLITQKVALGSKAIAQDLSANSELTAGSISFSPA